MKRTHEDFVLINTQRFPKGIKRYLNPILVLINVLLRGPFVDVIFLNSSRGGTKYLVPILFLFAKLFRTKFVFRPFGGNIKDYTASYNTVQKWLFRNTVLKADIFFLQTKSLMQFYANQNANTIQLPTSRERPPVDLVRGSIGFRKRFIYLGFVNQAKGIDHIIEAAQQLGKAYEIHIYGPIKEKRYEQIFKEYPNIYKGVLKKEEVLQTLNKYDVLMLPTFYDGEGYPGAIIEAYSLGLPVITTYWKAIPEIVINQQTGLLIEPRSTETLTNAIAHFNADNYDTYSKQARKYFIESFSSDEVNARVMTSIKKIAGFVKESDLKSQTTTRQV